MNSRGSWVQLWRSICCSSVSVQKGIRSEGWPGKLPAGPWRSRNQQDRQPTCLGQYFPARAELSRSCSMSSCKDLNVYLLQCVKETSKTRGLLNIHSNSIFYGSVNKHALNTTNVPHTYAHTHTQSAMWRRAHTRAHTHSHTRHYQRGKEKNKEELSKIQP